MKGKIEYEIDYNPFQPGYQKAEPGIPTAQYSNLNDIFANLGRSNGVIDDVQNSKSAYDNNSNKGHSIYDSEDKIHLIPKSNNNENTGPIPPVYQEHPGNDATLYERGKRTIKKAH